MDKINILHIYQNSKIGGVQQQLLILVNSYDKGVFNPAVCCFGPKEDIGREMENTGIEFVPLNKKNYSRFSPGIIIELYKLMKKRHVHIVRTHRYRANLYGRLAAWMAGVPVIIASVHDNYRTDKRLGRRIINRILSNITDRIIAVSESIKEDIIRYDKTNPSRILVIPNGIDISRFHAIEKSDSIKKNFLLNGNDIVIGFVGRLVPAKGLEYLIEAISCLQEKFKNIKLILVGNGSSLNLLQNMAKEKNIYDRVVFAGERRDIPDILSCIDIFVMPSIAEGLPNALLEAMAMGKSIVATKVGGVPEVIKNGVTGILVPPRDYNALATAIKELICNSQQAERMGQAARELVLQNYNITAIAKKWESLYRSILEEKRYTALHLSY